ncbi:hypothetical protein B0H13DRAFT_1856085 [Mycena leptocephala]|nr:hypothetical protein B0H13DRAFT_1856085 [Mycena leptocephala]
MTQNPRCGLAAPLDAFSHRTAYTTTPVDISPLSKMTLAEKNGQNLCIEKNNAISIDLATSRASTKESARLRLASEGGARRRRPSGRFLRIHLIPMLPRQLLLRVTAGFQWDNDLLISARTIACYHGFRRLRRSAASSGLSHQNNMPNVSASQHILTARRAELSHQSCEPTVSVLQRRIISARLRVCSSGVPSLHVALGCQTLSRAREVYVAGPLIHGAVRPRCLRRTSHPHGALRWVVASEPQTPSSSWRVAPGPPYRVDAYLIFTARRVGLLRRTADLKAFASQTTSSSGRVAPGPPHRVDIIYLTFCTARKTPDIPHLYIPPVARSLVISPLGIYCGPVNLQSYKEVNNDNGGYGSSSPVGSGPDSRPPSRSRSHSATPAHTGIALAAKRYRNPMQSLDFSGAGISSTGNNPIEDENHGRTTWPKIYRLFTNDAPIQVTSVPSERVFSSSAETDTKRRNRISPMLMEALQMLKFNFKKARLNFMSEWQSPLVAEDEEDWLRDLAMATDEQKNNIRREISDSCEFAEAEYMEMPEENDG